MNQITSNIVNSTRDKNEKLKLINDYVFKKIFSKAENNIALKELLEAILNIKIEKVEVQNPEMPKNFLDEKLGILDIKAYVDNMIVDIEMQVKNVFNMVERNISYMAKLETEQLRVGEEYKATKKVISINILGENLLKRNTYHSIAHLKFEKIREEEYVDLGYKEEQELLTDKEEVHYIELKKFQKKNPGIGSKLEQWLWLIIGEGEKIKMASEKNKTIKNVVKEIDEMSMNEQERWEAYQREVELWSYNVGLEHAKEEGEKLEKQKIAKKMKEKGLDINTIIEVTGLAKEEIENMSCN